MSRSRALRVTAIGTAAVAAVAVVVVLVLVVTFVRRPLPERGGDVALEGLSGEVEVIRDDQGVPTIYADDADDLMRAQGYVHAQDRFFEMDLRRHITAGRLSELVGRNDSALEADTVVRTLGWRRVAQEELAELTPQTRGYLEAYAEGVNDYLRNKSASELSVSYTLLARANPLPRIEPWTPVDSLAWLKAMAWDLRSNYGEELGRARALTTVRDVKRIEQLYPPYPYAEHPPITSETGDLSTRPRGTPHAAAAPERRALANAATGATETTGTAAEQPEKKPAASPVETALAGAAAQRAFAAAAEAIDAVPGLGSGGDGIGSNSWVVSGDLTDTGKPLLANDPHLTPSIPGIWYQNGLRCRTVSEQCPFDVTGFGFAGMPGVVVGHNAKIAWGLTNLYSDTTDFYLERVAGDRVESGGAMKPMTLREETITIAGSDPVTFTVRETPHGPLLSDALEDVAEGGRSAPVREEDNRATDFAVALSWTALEPGRAMDAIFAIDTAENFADFRAAAKLLDSPAQNLVYADTDGNIGYQAPGRLPIRGPGRAGEPVPSDGTWPHPGWDPAYDWQGWQDPERLPWVLNPPEGYVVAANQAAKPAGGLPITADWDYGYRSGRIGELLEKAAREQRKLTAADMRTIQSDTRNGIAATLVPLLLDVHDAEVTKDPFTSEAVDLLRTWDYSQPTDSSAAAYFNVVWATVLRLAFADELPDGFRPDGGDRWFAAVSSLVADKGDQWWDDLGTPDVRENRDEILRRAMSSARLELTSTLGKDPGRWQWGRLHRLRLEQTPLGGDGAPGIAQQLVNRGPYPAPGGTAIVSAFGWDASSGTFDVVAAPSMRMIVDLADLDRSRWVNQTGVSGHPWDSHYDDQIDAWLEGDDYAWPFTRDAVVESADDTQTFSPGSG